MAKKAEQQDVSQGPDDGAYQDVSQEVEQAEKDAQAPLEYDDDGNPVPPDSSAGAAVQAEMAHRAAGAGEGGGPFPPEVLQGRYLGESKLQRPEEQYTSDQDQ